MAVSIFASNVVMNEYIMKSLLHFVRFREILPFHFIFSLLKNFPLVKKCALTKFLYVVWASIRSSEKSESSILSSCVARFFFVRGDDGMIGCEKVEVIWRREKKNGRNQSNTWQHHCAFWGRLMEQVWWKKGGLWPSPRISVPRGNGVWLHCQSVVNI